jgi:hypothetical protein
MTSDVDTLCAINGRKHAGFGHANMPDNTTLTTLNYFRHHGRHSTSSCYSARASWSRFLVINHRGDSDMTLATNTNMITGRTPPPKANMDRHFHSLSFGTPMKIYDDANPNTTPKATPALAQLTNSPRIEGGAISLMYTLDRSPLQPRRPFRQTCVPSLKLGVVLGQTHTCNAQQKSNRRHGKQTSVCVRINCLAGDSKGRPRCSKN